MQLAPARASIRLAAPRPLVGGALCAGLMAAVAWAVLSGGWVSSGGGGAVVVGVAAAVEGALLAQARVPRFVTVVLAPVLALAAIVPTTLGSMPNDGIAGAGHVVGRYLAALVGGLSASSDWPFVVGLCAVIWLCGYWLAWMALRELRGVLAVIPLFAVLATNILNTKNPNNVALPEAIAVCLSLVVVAGAHLDALQARWARQRVPPLPGMETRFAVSVAAAAVLLTVAALLIPPISTADLSSRFFPGGGGASGRGQGRLGGTGTIQFNGATVPGGALVSQPKQVLTYTNSNNAAVYLRVIDDTQFLAGNWYPNEGGSPQSSVQFGGLAFNAPKVPRDRSVSDGGVGADEAAVHTDITLQPGATGQTSEALFAGEPDTTNKNGIAFGLLDSSRSRALLTVDSVQMNISINPGTRVSTTGLIPTASIPELRSAGRDYPAFVQQYTALQDDDTRGGEVISQLAQQWTAGTTNPYDAATAIEEHLRNPRFFTYTLDPPASPEGEWPIVYFLTVSHQGYCQYYAASMGAMLRSLGVPTRLVSGYGPGTAQSQTGGRHGVRQQVVTTSDAHIWVEAYFPKYGWIPFEPTPPSIAGNYAPFQRGAAAAAVVPTPSSAPATAGPALKPGFAEPPISITSTPSTGSSGPAPLVVLGSVAGAGLLVMLAYILWLVRPRSPRGAWRRLETLGIARGMPRRTGETHREYANRVAAAAPRVAPALRELASLMGRYEFARSGVDDAAARRAISLWRSILMAAPRAILASRRRHVSPV